MVTLFIAAFLGFGAGAILAWWYETSRNRPERIVLEKQLRTLQAQCLEARSDLEQAREQMSVLRAEVARLEERNAAEKRALEQMRASLPETFKSLASEVLREKSREFAEQNQSSLGQMLGPLSSRLQDFQKKIEDVHLEQVRGSATLREQVTRLVESTGRVSSEANSLASALKGSNKAQGTWGEFVLARILESAGLRRGQEYEAQESYAGENGRRAQPDVVVHLPGERHLVIDSKVSLVAYEAHCNAEDDAARSAAFNEHLNSIRAHIKGLSEKNYQSLYGLKSLDFVIMFLPIEPAFLLALSRDEKLWEQAWQKSVLLVSPSSLLFVLRTVSYLWRQEQQERNVEEIVKRGEMLYNKLAGFVDDLQAVGKGLDLAQSKYAEAFSKLHTGTGNVIRQAEMLKALGIKPSKQLAQGLVELAQQESLQLGKDGEGPAG
ncbi:MAG TPA: DNA recombination protein RmuC [Acidobacteriaceae bacterium]|nr:DNA recombination protein RmuC [Acidobacteriaceae bacterium]